jgi:tetratricopeptide (TPR) repeat protein
VTDDIRSLTAQLAADPTSLVFLRLGEALRQRGQLDAAGKVALAGLGRYPHLPDAHDLYARILTDRRDYATAFDEWDTVLRLAPGHLGAHKGIGFLYYRAGELDQAMEHLRIAAQADPDDEGLRAALERVAGGREVWDVAPAAVGSIPDEEAAPAPVPAAADPFAGLEGGHDRVLLVDPDGFRLGGGLVAPDGRDVSEATSAAVTAVSREAARAARILELGDWSSLTVEYTAVSCIIQHPTPEATLLTALDAGMPAGQLALHAERAMRVARSWMERVR